MKKSRFTESQILAIPKEGEAGLPDAQLTRKHGISAATDCRWKSEYGGAGVSELKCLRDLEAENAKLTRMYAELALENAAVAIGNASTDYRLKVTAGITNGHGGCTADFD